MTLKIATKTFLWTLFSGPRNTSQIVTKGNPPIPASTHWKLWWASFDMLGCYGYRQSKSALLGRVVNPSRKSSHRSLVEGQPTQGMSTFRSKWNRHDWGPWTEPNKSDQTQRKQQQKRESGPSKCFLPQGCHTERQAPKQLFQAQCAIDSLKESSGTCKKFEMRHPLEITGINVFLLKNTVWSTVPLL